MIAAVREFLSAPGRRRQLAVVAGAAIVVLGAFELGQMRAGYNTLEAQVAQRRLSRQLGKLQAENRQAAAQLARLQTDEQVNRQAYAQVEQQLAELQGMLMDQHEEVAFYRGIVGGNSPGALRIQDFALAAAASGNFRLRFVLARAERTDSDVRGQLQVRVEGVRAGRPISLDLAAMTVGEQPLPRTFDLRYFQEVTAEVRVPADFVPERVVIRIAPTSRGLKASVESFPWAVRAG